jgi:lipoate-protein ligase A
MAQLKVFLSDSFNPHLNLATEEWIFHHMDPGTQVLFLWRNEETVVIGRTQNPWSECNLQQMKEDNVHLARRTTGGGAVFHDLGNTNFTFLSPKDEYKRDNNVQIILNALKKFGIEGEASGRNDLMMNTPDGQKKFSGSAYREKKDRAFHHGTLLLSADLTRLGRYLTPNPKKLQAKGKTSVRARVANLNEQVPGIEHSQIVEAVVASFENFYGGKAEKEFLTMSSLQQIPLLKQQYDELSSWEWLYGKTLEFNQQMTEYLSLGFFEFNFHIEDGIIRNLQIFSDCLFPALIETLTLALKGQPFSSQTINDVIPQIKDRFPDLADGVEEIGDWLKKQIEI